MPFEGGMDEFQKIPQTDYVVTTGGAIRELHVWLDEVGSRVKAANLDRRLPGAPDGERPFLENIARELGQQFSRTGQAEEIVLHPWLLGQVLNSTDERMREVQKVFLSVMIMDLAETAVYFQKTIIEPFVENREGQLSPADQHYHVKVKLAQIVNNVGIVGKKLGAIMGVEDGFRGAAERVGKAYLDLWGVEEAEVLQRLDQVPPAEQRDEGVRWMATKPGWLEDKNQQWLDAYGVFKGRLRFIEVNAPRLAHYLRDNAARIAAMIDDGNEKGIIQLAGRVEVLGELPRGDQDQGRLD